MSQNDFESNVGNSAQDEVQDNPGESGNDREFASNESSLAGKENTSSDDYFEDDENLLKSETVEERDFGVFPQGSNMVSWEIVGLYDTDGKQLSTSALKNEPPVLRVSSVDGNEAEFMLTRDFSQSMYAAFDDVRRAHSGMEVKRGMTRSKQTLVESMSSFKDSVVNQPVKYGFLFLFFVLIIVALVYSAF